MSKITSILKSLEVGAALKKANSLGPDSTIKEIKDSGLRGRGGAGFPTGLKLEFTKSAAGNEKVIVCNADEGEVGTFKDRELIINVMPKLLEGMAIAAYVVGANKAIIYLRGEYNYLKTHVLEHIQDFNKISDLEFELKMGSGAYVCGEETALLESLEGKRGEPRNKPPYPVEAGYLNLPTAINNVETFCCIPHILIEGAAAFAAIGTEKSKGPKLFSISGDVEKPGVYELPLGTTISDMLKVVGAKDTKAVLAGGASGTCVGKEGFSRKLAFEDLPPGGAIVVFNNTRQMIDVAENLMDFFAEESCGQCVPCREGTYQILEFCKKLKKGDSISQKDLTRYLDLVETMAISSKCGLGQSSITAFSSIFDSFKDEFIKIKN